MNLVNSSNAWAIPASTFLRASHYALLFLYSTVDPLLIHTDNDVTIYIFLTCMYNNHTVAPTMGRGDYIIAVSYSLVIFDDNHCKTVVLVPKLLLQIFSSLIYRHRMSL